mmetsp:Transcript_2859/g.4166  ORF Transcript_2859/g.4166 Transcript_2859/m.4166 type:complete len:322 (+) Transcript_2859:100-1065(+)
MADVRRMTNGHHQPTHPTDASSKRIAALEATNAALREALSSKNAHIAMLEDKILTISVELASSRAREDEQNLMLRQSIGQVVSQEVIMMSEEDDDHDDNMNIPDSLVPNPVRNGRRRRGSRGSSAISPCPDNSATIDDSIKSAPPAAAQQTSSMRRFSFMTNHHDFDDSARSLGSTGVGGIIGNIFNNLDRSDKSDDLSVNFPTGRRRSSMMTTDTTNDYSSSTSSSAVGNSQEPRRVSMVGQLFRLRKSELTPDDAVEEESCEQEEEEEEQQPAEEEEQPMQRRRPNRSKLANRYMMSTRLISSTVAFPREDDDDCLGFE